MSQIAMPTPHRPVLASRRTTTRRNSFTDDEDAITPCSSPPPEPSHPTFASAYDLDTKRPASPRFTPSRRGSTSPNTASSSSSSAAAAAAAVGGSAGPSRKASTVGAPSSFHFDPTEGEELSDAQLWRRMLAIQQEFHCYNSARLSAALLGLEMGVDVGQLAPSRKCLDLINDSMSDLAIEEKQRLTEWLHEHSSKRKKAGSSMWRRSTGSIS